MFLHAWVLLYICEHITAYKVCVYVYVCVRVCVYAPQGKAPDGLKTMNNLPDPLIILSDSISSWSNQAGEAVHF